MRVVIMGAGAWVGARDRTRHRIRRGGVDRDRNRSTDFRGFAGRTVTGMVSTEWSSEGQDTDATASCGLLGGQLGNIIAAGSLARRSASSG